MNGTEAFQTRPAVRKNFQARVPQSPVSHTMTEQVKVGKQFGLSAVALKSQCENSSRNIHEMTEILDRILHVRALQYDAVIIIAYFQ